MVEVLLGEIHYNFRVDHELRNQIHGASER